MKKLKNLICEKTNGNLDKNGIQIYKVDKKQVQKHKDDDKISELNIKDGTCIKVKA